MGNKLFIGNLSFSTTGDSLTSMFAECGNVQSAKVITDRDTGRSKGFGFVEMSSDDEANKAIGRFNGSDLDGRAISVSEAKPMAPRDNNRGGGSYGRR